MMCMRCSTSMRCQILRGGWVPGDPLVAHPRGKGQGPLMGKDSGKQGERANIWYLAATHQLTSRLILFMLKTTWSGDGRIIIPTLWI